MSTYLAKIIADFETQLATKLSAGASTCDLQSITDDDGVVLPNGIYFFTFDGDNSQKEHIVATLTGTALTAIKSISRQGVQTANAVREHRVGASVKITDFAHIKYMNDLLDGTTGFDSAVKIGYDGDPSINSSDLNKFATVTYVNGVAVAGAPNASTTVKGIAEEATQAEIDADTAAGATAARLFVNPSTLVLSKYGLRLPTANEKLALAGSSGAVGSLNKYLSEDDATVYGGGVTQQSQNATQAVGEADATTKANKICQTFIPTLSSQIAIYLHKLANTGTNAGDVIIEFFAVDGSNNPTGAALASTTITAATWNGYSTGNNYIAITYTFTIGTTYAMQVRQSTADTSNHINLGYQNTDVYASGTLKRYNVTDGWVSITGDLTFSLFGTVNNKVIRRTGTGTAYMATAPVANTDLTNKLYVDSITSPHYVGVGIPSRLYYSSMIPFLINTGGGMTAAIWTLTTHTLQYYYNYGVINGSGGGGQIRTPLATAVGTQLTFGTKKVIIEYILKVNSTGTNSITFGLGCQTNSFDDVYNGATNDTVAFTISNAGNLYGHTTDGGGGASHTETQITGITVTNENRYRIEYNPGVSALFYVNGVLKATITTTLPDGNNAFIGFGSSGATNYVTSVSSPYLAVEV